MAIKRYQISFKNFTTVLLALLLITTILGWKILIAQRQIQQALMISKALNSWFLSYHLCLQNASSQAMPQGTLQKISSPFTKNKFLKMSFNYEDATLWNSLPCDLRPEKDHLIDLNNC